MFRYCIKPKAKPSVQEHIDMTDFYDDDYDLDDEYSDEEVIENAREDNEVDT